MGNMLTARAAALRDFESLPDDAQVGFAEIALLEGRSEAATRQAFYEGKLGLRRVKGTGRKVKFRVGDYRQRVRGEEVA